LDRYKFIFTFSLFIQFCLSGQSIQVDLLKSNMSTFRGSFFVYGFKSESNENQTVFKCLKYDQEFKLTDSIELVISQQSATQYLEIELDTIHQSLIFYFQKINETKVKVLRVSDKFKLINVSDNIDANHINSVKLNTLHSYYYGNHLLTITKYKDSLSDQFYLNQYDLNIDASHFEYKLNWQYAFERQNIKDINVLYSDSLYSYLYALVIDGVKKGEWILKIDLHKGNLVKGTKLNLKTEQKIYFPPNLCVNQSSKSLICVGSVSSSQAFDFTNNETKLTMHLNGLYLFEIDSLFDIQKRTEKAVAIPMAINTLAKTNSIIINPLFIQKKDDTKFELITNVYSKLNNETSYLSSWVFGISFQNEEYLIEPMPFYNLNATDPKIKMAQIEKMELKTPDEFYRFFQIKNITPLLVYEFVLDKPYYYIIKNNVNENTVSFIKYSLGSKTLESILLGKVNKDMFPKFYFTKNPILFKRVPQTERAQIDVIK
jgi:hypothetical protein